MGKIISVLFVIMASFSFLILFTYIKIFFLNFIYIFNFFHEPLILIVIFISFISAFILLFLSLSFWGHLSFPPYTLNGKFRSLILESLFSDAVTCHL